MTPGRMAYPGKETFRNLLWNRWSEIKLIWQKLLLDYIYTKIAETIVVCQKCRVGRGWLIVATVTLKIFPENADHHSKAYSINDHWVIYKNS